MRAQVFNSNKNFAWENEIHYSLSAWFLTLCPIATKSDIHFWRCPRQDKKCYISLASRRQKSLANQWVLPFQTKPSHTPLLLTWSMDAIIRENRLCRDIKTKGSPTSLSYFGQNIVSLSDPLNLNPCLQPPLTITLIT